MHTSAPIACTAGIGGLARDLLCVTTGVNGVALDDSWGNGTFALTLRNVTAIATGAGSYGIRADSSGNNTNLDISARNVIAFGIAADIRSTEVGLRSESDVLLTNSNYDKIEEGGGGNVTNVGFVSSNQTALPVFADNTLFHQGKTSPTIDKGASDASVGTSDLDGSPRKIGSAVDIGADEFDPTPPDVAFDSTPKHRTHKHKAKFIFHASESVTFFCVVDNKAMAACTSPMKLKFKKRGKHTLMVSAMDAVGNVDATPGVLHLEDQERRSTQVAHHEPPLQLWVPAPRDIVLRRHPCRGRGARTPAGRLGRPRRPRPDGAVHALPPEDHRER